MYLLLLSIIAITITRSNYSRVPMVGVKKAHRQQEGHVVKEKGRFNGIVMKPGSENKLLSKKVEQNDITSKNSSTDRQQDEDIMNNKPKPALVMGDNVTAFVSTPTEIRHIGFLKVHKAASSTMQNIFFRFGLKLNLSFVLTEHPNYFSRSVTASLPLIRPKFRDGYDILCNHGMFNYTLYSSILPKDTIYIGIVRDPLDVFISAVNYYSQRSQMLSYLARIKVNKLKKLIHRPEVYDRGFFSYTKNVMARDFGFLPSSDMNMISGKLEELGKIFNLVLIVERFEESLVLMRRYLNWKMQDILFIPNNVYVSPDKTVSAAQLGARDKQAFRIRNNLDYQVYEFFLNKFQRQITDEPGDINLEVLQFREVLANASAFCNSIKHTAFRSKAYLVVEESEWNEEFRVTDKDCWFMRLDELRFINILRHKQGSELRPQSQRRRPHQVGQRLESGYGGRMGYQKRRPVRNDKMVANY